jgi:hypothetical protein
VPVVTVVRVHYAVSNVSDGGRQLASPEMTNYKSPAEMI